MQDRACPELHSAHTFFSTWTSQVHALGGVHVARTKASGSSGIVDVMAVDRCGVIAKSKSSPSINRKKTKEVGAVPPTKSICVSFLFMFIMFVVLCFLFLVSIRGSVHPW
jgi:hypothetical protein